MSTGGNRISTYILYHYYCTNDHSDMIVNLCWNLLVENFDSREFRLNGKDLSRRTIRRNLGCI